MFKNREYRKKVFCCSTSNSFDNFCVYIFSVDNCEYPHFISGLSFKCKLDCCKCRQSKCTWAQDIDCFQGIVGQNITNRKVSVFTVRVGSHWRVGSQPCDLRYNKWTRSGTEGFLVRILSGKGLPCSTVLGHNLNPDGCVAQ
jgi:hypothetical protein